MTSEFTNIGRAWTAGKFSEVEKVIQVSGDAVEEQFSRDRGRMSSSESKILTTTLCGSFDIDTGRRAFERSPVLCLRVIQSPRRLLSHMSCMPHDQ